MRVWRMRTGISITLKPADRRRLKGLARDRNAPHKHVWRAESMMAKVVDISASSVQRIWRTHGLQPHRVKHFKLSDPQLVDKLRDIIRSLPRKLARTLAPSSSSARLRSLRGRVSQA